LTFNRRSDMSTIIKIKAQPERPFKEETARAAWWEVIQKHDGKDTEALEKSVKRKAPAKTSKGKVEAPAGWLSYFKREGLIELVETEDAESA
jgi:hypothetical protein